MTAAVVAVAIRLVNPAVTPADAATWGRIVLDESRPRGVDPLLVVALVSAESGWDPRKSNKRTRAAGLMQVMPVHWGNADPHGVRWNLATGIGILGGALVLCAWKQPNAVSIYNGRGNCRPSVFSARVMRIRRKLDSLEVKS